MIGRGGVRTSEPSPHWTAAYLDVEPLYPSTLGAAWLQTGATFHSKQREDERPSFFLRSGGAMVAGKGVRRLESTCICLFYDRVSLGPLCNSFGTTTATSRGIFSPLLFLLRCAEMFVFFLRCAWSFFYVRNQTTNKRTAVVEEQRKRDEGGMLIV